MELLRKNPNNNEVKNGNVIYLIKYELRRTLNCATIHLEPEKTRNDNTWLDIVCVCVRLIMNQSWSFKGNKRNFCLFVFSGLLCSWILSSTHYKCIYTSTQPTFIYPVFSVFWLAAPNIEREKKTANNIKNDFCANRNNNNNEKWFKVSIVYGTQKNWMSCVCLWVRFAGMKSHVRID